MAEGRVRVVGRKQFNVERVRVRASAETNFNRSATFRSLQRAKAQEEAISIRTGKRRKRRASRK